MSEQRKTARQQLRMESLESRHLLSADLAYGSATDLTLRLATVNSEQVYQLVDTNQVVIDSANASAAGDGGVADTQALCGLAPREQRLLPVRFVAHPLSPVFVEPDLASYRQRATCGIALARPLSDHARPGIPGRRSYRSNPLARWSACRHGVAAF